MKNNSPESMASFHALELRKYLIELGYKKPDEGQCSLTCIWEHPDGEVKIEVLQNQISIRCQRRNQYSRLKNLLLKLSGICKMNSTQTHC